MNEAIAVIKGVLGFEDTALTVPPRFRRPTIPAQPSSSSRPHVRRNTDYEESMPLVGPSSSLSNSRSNSQSQSNPFFSPSKDDSGKGKRGPAPPVPKNPPRGRHPSHSYNPLSSPSVEAPLLGDSSSPFLSALETAAERQASLRPGFTQANHHIQVFDDDEDENGDDIDGNDDGEDAQDLTAPRLRLWTFPSHITDPEIDDLLALFPSFLTGSTGVKNLRIPLVRPPRKGDDLESQIPSESSSWPIVFGIHVPPEASDRFVRPGTGRLWVSEELRLEGWRGSFWQRVAKWFRQLFGGS